MDIETIILLAILGFALGWCIAKIVIAFTGRKPVQIKESKDFAKIPDDAFSQLYRDITKEAERRGAKPVEEKSEGEQRFSQMSDVELMFFMLGAMTEMESRKGKKEQQS